MISITVFFLLFPSLILSQLLSSPSSSSAGDSIPRHALVSRYNPTRTTSDDTTTPMQIGNGNFAFGSDVTGLQTLQPWAIMGNFEWVWKNDSLPANRTWEDVRDYEGVKWFNHGRLVQYEFLVSGGDEEVQQWLISNPNRVNLARTGLTLLSPSGTPVNITPSSLSSINQTLDLWSGTITSSFLLSIDDNNSTFPVTVRTAVHQDPSLAVISISITSPLLDSSSSSSHLALFVDFPWNDGSQKFSDPYVGSFDSSTWANHTTRLYEELRSIEHSLVNATFWTRFGGDVGGITRDDQIAHRYTLRPSTSNNGTVSLTISFTPAPPSASDIIPSPESIFSSSSSAWTDFWSTSGFVDVSTESTDPRADELQRRIILSRYLERVNSGGDFPPQESGLVNNGWYGKFHLEMFFWHECHWALWNNWDILNRSITVYDRFLQTSIWRAEEQQGWMPAGPGAEGRSARWGKMSDPSGRSAPGEINELLIWQHPHPLIFALYSYRSHPTRETLRQWVPIVEATANWMAADFAFWNQTTGVYDLGPPMYVVAEDTAPKVTVNPAFEGAYWRLGLAIAREWVAAAASSNGENDTSSSSSSFAELQQLADIWAHVQSKLAPLPLNNYTGQELYAVYEGIDEDFWVESAYTNDHPALVGLLGWLPPIRGVVDPQIANSTRAEVVNTWNVSNLWGWDFPLLALSSARQNIPQDAISWLLHPLFQFDDVGMPVGGVRVPTPYFPGSGALLYAVGAMAAGWDEQGGVLPFESGEDGHAIGGGLAEDVLRGVRPEDGVTGDERGTAKGFPAREEGWVVKVEGMNRAI